jgi:hypothetical protein
MTATRLLTSTAQLAACAACAALTMATVLMVPLDGAAQAAGSRVALVPAPDGFFSVTLDVGDLLAQRKSAWAADRVDRHLF